MTERQAREGTSTIIARRRLTEEEVRKRLSAICVKKYGADSPFPVDHYVDECINSVHLTEVWIDSFIKCVVVYNASTDLYIIISTGEYFDLVE